MPVFSCDSGLYFDGVHGVQEEIQPGVHVRNVNGRSLLDEDHIYEANTIMTAWKKIN